MKNDIPIIHNSFDFLVIHPIETKFARRKTQIFTKIEQAVQDLHDAILEISDLQDEFVLSETSIEYVDEWSSAGIHTMNDIDHRVTDLDSALFDNTTIILFDEED